MRPFSIRRQSVLLWLIGIIIFCSFPTFLFWGKEAYAKLLVGICVILYFSIRRPTLSSQNVAPLLLTFFYILYSSFPGAEGTASFINFAYCSLIFYFFTDEERTKYINLTRRMLAIILLLGILVYPLIVFNILPSLYEIPNNIRETTYYVYPFSVVEDLSFAHPVYLLFHIYRFNSIFDEPGVVGTLSALMLLIRPVFDRRNKENIIFLIAGILSFSLAFWVLITLVFLINLRLNWTTLLTVLSFGCIIMLFREPLNEIVFSRLEIEDGKMKGDNRIQEDFQIAYRKFEQSNSLYFGRGNIAHQNYPGSATYKSIIFNQGIFGFMLYLAIFIWPVIKTGKWRCYLFLLVFLINIYQRPYSISIIYLLILYAGTSYYSQITLPDRKHTRMTGSPQNKILFN